MDNQKREELLMELVRRGKAPDTDLTQVPTDRLLDELAKREGFTEIEITGRLYEEWDLVRRFYDDPERHFVADRVLLLNLRNRPQNRLQGRAGRCRRKVSKPR